MLTVTIVDDGGQWRHAPRGGTGGKAVEILAQALEDGDLALDLV